MSANPIIALVQLLSLLLWCQVAVLLWDWAGVLRRTAHHEKVGVVVDLLGALVPAVVFYIAMVFTGAVFGLRSVVVFLALVVPAGLIFSVRLALAEDLPSTRALERRRTLVTLGLAVALTAYAQVRS